MDLYRYEKQGPFQGFSLTVGNIYFLKGYRMEQATCIVFGVTEKRFVDGFGT